LKCVAAAKDGWSVPKADIQKGALHFVEGDQVALVLIGLDLYYQQTHPVVLAGFRQLQAIVLRIRVRRGVGHQHHDVD
jgi:NaMN:DMB phosphoribosyltransferase